MIVSEAFELFFNYCRAERHASPSTVAKYRDCYRAWLAPMFGLKDQSSIDRLQVLKLREQMMDKQLSVSRQYSVIM